MSKPADVGAERVVSSPQDTDDTSIEVATRDDFAPAARTSKTISDAIRQRETEWDELGEDNQDPGEGEPA